MRNWGRVRFQSFSTLAVLGVYKEKQIEATAIESRHWFRLRFITNYNVHFVVHGQLQK
jgi:hypothetical protein